MKWREAKSLEQLLKQINAKWPNRSKLSDGTIGDAAHAKTKSDHNPNEFGVVCALDVTNDPTTGPVARQLADMLVASRDVRIKYIISNAQICSGIGGPSPWTWRSYTGVNAHRHHVHISVRSPDQFYDDITPWNITGAVVEPPVVEGTTLWIQRELNKHGATLTEDGKEGELTTKAIRAFAVQQLRIMK